MNTIEYQVGPPLFQWRRGGTIRCMVCQSSSVGRWLAFSFILVGACGRRGIEGFFRGVSCLRNKCSIWWKKKCSYRCGQCVTGPRYLMFRWILLFCVVSSCCYFCNQTYVNTCFFLLLIWQGNAPATIFEKKNTCIWTLLSRYTLFRSTECIAMWKHLFYYKSVNVIL
jgi:hypothetical protein